MAGIMQQNGQQQPPPPKSNSISFGSKPVIQKGPDPEVLAQLSNITRRVRLVEETVSNQRKKLSLSEENTLSDFKKLHANIKTMFGEIDEIKKENASFKEEMRKMIREFQTVAKKDDVAVLQKYIQLWEPVQFATVAQVEHMIQDAAEGTANGSETLFDNANTQLDADIRVEAADDSDSKTDDDEESVDPYMENTRYDEIFAPHDSDDDTSQNTTNQERENSPVIPSDITAESVDTSAEDEAAPLISPAQKKQIAILIETYEDIRNMILTDPDAFIKKVEMEPALSKLFRGVDILELSEKLKPHYT